MDREADALDTGNMSNSDYLQKNLAEVRSALEAAERAAGRAPGSVTLLAAVKYASDRELNVLVNRFGVRDVGENRVQQLLAHREAIDLPEDLRVHFIGTLQTNKVKYIIDKVAMIHSVDSLKLAREIDRQAKKHGLVMDILVEINSGEEENKSGILPTEAGALCREIGGLDSVRLCGFMTMAPRCRSAEEYRGYFLRTRELAMRIWREELGREGTPLLSMGMSESFGEAIACGSDLVRIGRRLFLHETEPQKN